MRHKAILFSMLLSLIILCTVCSPGDTYGRLGIEVPVGKGKITDDTPYVIHAVYDGPAYKAGLKADDIIVQIDGIPLRKGMTHDYVYNKLLRGKANTKVTIVVERKGKRHIFDVVRAPAD